MIDMDQERGRDPSTVPEDKRDLHRVAIRKSATVDLNNIYAYLNGQVDFGPGVIDAISKFRSNSFGRSDVDHARLP